MIWHVCSGWLSWDSEELVRGGRAGSPAISSCSRRDVIIDVSPEGGNGKARFPAQTGSEVPQCGARLSGQGATGLMLTGLRVSATSPVLAGADLHSDCCGVSCPSLC